MAARRPGPANLARTAIVGPPFAWLLLFFFTPFVIVAAISLGQNAPDSRPVAMTGTVRNYAFLLSDALYLDAYLSSLRIAAISTALTLLLGYPMAYAIAMAAPSRRAILLMLVILPFWTSFLIRVYAWRGLLSENGLVNAVIRAIGLSDDPGSILGTEWAIYLGIVYAYLPFMVLPLYASLEARPLAARGCGRPRRQAIRLPCHHLAAVTAGIVAGCLLVFIPAVGEFVIPDCWAAPRP